MKADDHYEDDHTFIARAGELTEVPWRCAACGTGNDTFVELTAGYLQEYVEDCRRCCRPNLIRIYIDRETHLITLGNELEYE